MTPRVHHAMTASEWGMLLTLSALWGSSFFFFKVLVAALPPFTVVLGRVALAALVLNGYLAMRGTPMRAPAARWRAFAGMGVLNNVVPFCLIAWAETRISSGLASILNATTPIFTVLAAHALTSESLTWARGLGVLFGFAGVIVLIGPDALSGLASADLVGELACLLAAASYALAGLYGRRFKGLPPLQVATGQLTASAILLLPLAAVVDRFWNLPMPDAAAWSALAAIAVVCTVLAYVLYFRILASAGPTNLLLVTFLLPISALLLGRIVLGEHIEPAAYGGMALIGLGLLAIDGRALQRLRDGVSPAD